jgi:alpha-1,2-mannosyltransferase
MKPSGFLRARPSAADLRRLFIVIGALMVVAGVVNVVAFDWTSEATAGKPYDFDLNWIAAQRLVDGRPLYDRAASRAEGLRLVGPEMNDTNHGPFSSFIGLPSTALLYTPFTPFDAGTAADLYRLVDLLAMLAAVLVTLLALPPPSRLPAGLIAVGAFLLSSPVTKSIWLGQVDGFLMLGLAVAFLGVRRERWGWVGVGIAVAALLKFSPVILLVYLALRGTWRAVWWALATVVVVLGAAAIIGRPGDLGDWFHTVANSVSQGARNTDNQALPAALARLFSHSDDLLTQAPLGAWRFVSYFVVLIGVLGLWWLRRGRRIEPLDLGVLVLVALLAGPVSWDHYLTWSLLVLVLVADLARWAGRSWGEIFLVGAPVAGAVALMRTWTTYPFPDQVAAHPYMHVTTSVKTLGVVLLLGSALWLLLRPVPGARADAEPAPADADLVTTTGRGLARGSAVP